MTDLLPVRSVLADLRAALADPGSAVLIAPPGAGKTTVIAPELLDEDWCTGQIILTSPRRVAARAAAERMAAMLGERPGDTIGYLSRLDSKTTARTRVLVMTEAILVNRLVEQPELPRVSAILFDEAHERHLDSDLALALAVETRDVLRDDLRLLVMSATIDGARFARLLGANAPVVESAGRSYPLTTRYLGGNASTRIEDRVTAGVMHAWRDEAGDILAFLPGIGEIERTRERLAAKLPDTPILPLHGQVDPGAQRSAIARDPQGRRRIVLASAIAETSLTLDNVSVVVDSGLARMAEYDRAAGTIHLVTRTASQAATEQRAGRAARQGPGVAYRLWEEWGQLGRPKFAPPEIETADLAGLILKLALRGSSDPDTLAWLDPPPAASVEAARDALQKLGALDAEGRITRWGEAIAAMPMAPNHAAAVLHGARSGCGEDAARLILLLQERGLGGRGENLAARLGQWRANRSRRASQAARITKGWAQKAGKLTTGDETREIDMAECLALARSDFVARRRDATGEEWLSVGGRGFTLDPTSTLARSEWVVIGNAQGQAKGARITAGIALDPTRIEKLFCEQIEERSVARWNRQTQRVEARHEKRLGAIALTSGPDPDPDPEAIVDILVERAMDSLSTLFPPGFLERANFAKVEALEPQRLKDSAAIWLRPILYGRRDLDLAPGRYARAALDQLEYSARQGLDERAPTHFTSPAGTRHAIDYASDDAPSVEIRAQALFGLDHHPTIGPKNAATSLLLKLTSPAGRPIQSTRDLPGFWRGSWRDVAKEMKGRYPKHRWPDEPWDESASLKTKNAFNRS